MSWEWGVGRGECASGRRIGRVADWLRRIGGALLIGVFSPLPTPHSLLAQVSPTAHWQTIATPHFRIHFAPPLEDQARRAAVNAERAWAELAAELVPPRGPVDIVISDDVDYSNGAATVFPTNRIVIYAAPPVEALALRFNDDWNALVVTHELTHIFHLDRTRGIWAVGQAVFGRNPLLFPNVYSPSWLTEGLAVYYESRLTDAGRILGSEHRMIARAAAMEHEFPRLDQLSAATPRFPGGEAAYAYGSLFVDYLARTRGPQSVRKFVEASSAQLIPIWLDRAARRGFGISFQRAFAQWRDSLARAAGPEGPPLVGWRELTGPSFDAGMPRWRGDSALLFTLLPPREVMGAYRVTLDGDARRVGRRNSGSPQDPLANGSVLYAQLDFTDPYHVRSDLYTARDGDEKRLTRGARLVTPDARADGEIVAVQYVAAGTRLVRVARDGRAILPLNAGSPDLQWSEPRWSPDGRRIAAVRWRRGGVTEVVVLDTTGAVVRALAAARAVQSSPDWTPDGRSILFSSDVSGTTDVYVVPADGSGAPVRVSRAPTGLFSPALSPDGRTLAAVLFRADGFHIGVAPYAPDSASRLAGGPLPAPTAVARDTSAIHTYSPWRLLVPRYWLPLGEPALLGGTRWGAFTSAQDVVGRHAYAASLLVPTDASGIVGSLGYRYAGFGLPLVDVGLVQDWTLVGAICPSQGDCSAPLGSLRRRARIASLGATFVRPRVRTAASLSLGAGLEQRSFRTDPSDLLARLATPLADSLYPSLFASASWSNGRRPPYSISPEDGVSLGASVVQRWNTASGAPSSYTAVGALAGYRSLDLPGFAHHVLAARVAAGRAGRRATEALEVGGTSGSSLAVVPGVVLGEGQRIFGVRGFPSNTVSGYQALAGSVEYRAPLAIPARGLKLLPAFLDRTSLSLFGDAGAAWCPADRAASGLCHPTVSLHDPLASIGAELNIVAALLSWDESYRFRLGVVHPVAGMRYATEQGIAVRPVSVYAALGLSF